MPPGTGPPRRLVPTRSKPAMAHNIPRPAPKTAPAPWRITPVLRWWSIALAGTVPFFRILPFGNQWVIALIALPAVTVVMGAGKRPVAVAVWPIAAAFATVGALTSVAFAVDSDAHWVIAGQLVLLFALGPFAARGLWVSDPVRLGRRWAIGLVAGQTISAIAGMAQGFLGASVAGWQAELGRAPGLAGHPNILGLMSGIAIVLCVGEILDRGMWRWPAMVVATVNLGGLLAGGSVSSMIAAAVGLLVLLIAKRASLRIVVAAVAAAIGLGWLTVLAFTGGASTSPVDRVLQVTGQT